MCSEMWSDFYYFRFSFVCGLYKYRVSCINEWVDDGMGAVSWLIMCVYIV